MRGVPHRLATTLTIWIVLPIGVGFGAFLILNAARETKHARQQAERECEAWAAAMSLGLQRTLLTPADLQKMMAALIARQQMANPTVNLQFLDEYGRDVTNPTGLVRRPVSQVYLWKAMTIRAPVLYYEEHDRWLTYLQPLREPVGVLRVTMTMEEEFNRIRQNALTTAAIGIVTIVIVAVVLRFLMGWLVVHPLKTVVEAVEKIGAGDLSVRLPVLSENEIGTLALYINRMAVQRQEADAELRASEERYRQTIEQAIDAMFIADPDTGLIVDVNREAERLTGYTRDELCQMSVWALHPDDVSDRAHHLWERARTEAGALFEELLHVRKGDQPFIAGVSLGTIRYGTHCVIQRIVWDLTEQKQLAQTQRELELELLQQAKLSAIGAVVQGVTHNLLGPITVIRGYAELLQHANSDLPYLNIILKKCQHVEAIIENTLVKSRREQEQERRLLNLNDLIREELLFLEADLEFKHTIEKNYRLADDLPEIEGVYGDFSQSLMNIVRNALDAMHDTPQKRLIVATRYDDDTISVEISDTGCGIPPEHLAHIFDPFFTTKPVAGTERPGEPTGTGLGLSSCVRLLQPYQAQIDVKSELGQGTTFTVRLPRKPRDNRAGVSQQVVSLTGAE
ncbi:MAG: PAS domain S-box protein [Candidatus Latescibacteria bacterium]|nr:PAS domain S-box protein [Candidatus Latescibacterota bacterium]